MTAGLIVKLAARHGEPLAERVLADEPCPPRRTDPVGHPHRDLHGSSESVRAARVQSDEGELVAGPSVAQQAEGDPHRDTRHVDAVDHDVALQPGQVLVVKVVVELHGVDATDRAVVETLPTARAS